MRILIHDFAGHPFQVDLSRALARRGHSVVHAYSPEVTTGRGRLTRSDDDPVGLTIRPVEIGRPFSRYSLVRRPRDEIVYGRALGRQIDAFRPDVVVSANAPLLSQRHVLERARRRGAAFVYWLQDLLGVGTAMQLRRRLGPVARIPSRALERVERGALVNSDVVISITDGFLPRLRAIGVDTRRVEVIANWAPIDELPERPRRNRWAADHGLCDRFVFLYSGTLGLKHEPALLVELARHFRHDDDGVSVVVVSEGLGATWLRAEADRNGLENLVVLDYQPYDRLPEVLATADVLVALLDPSAGAFSVPSKVLTYLCAGRPVLAALPRENLATRTIEDAGAGIVIDTGDGRAFLSSATRLRTEPGTGVAMGQAARRYAERAFRIDVIAQRFESALKEATSLRAERLDPGQLRNKRVR
jgi:glycosyltransferase involved in cell wall biosynthesis